MERIWNFGDIAVSVERIDFVDPAVAHEPDARERGVRVELRPVASSRDGSIYASATTTVGPGSVRFDLLESRPGAADRMHWHPSMHDGEPGGRVFDEELSADPVGWLRSNGCARQRATRPTRSSRRSPAGSTGPASPGPTSSTTSGDSP